VFRQEGRTGTAGRATLGARSALVVTQVSLAFALLIGAALLLVSFGRKLSIEQGFEAEGVATASLSMPVARYPDAAARRAFLARALDAIRALPGVEHAGATSVIPFGGDFNSSVITPEGYEPKPGESPLSPIQSVVTPGYLEAMEIPLVRGRRFDARDTEGATPVVIIDEWLARRYWPDQDPLGKRLYQGVPEIDEEREYRTIVGITREIRMLDLAGADQVGHYYFPYDQIGSTTMFLTLQTSREPLSVIPAVRAEIARLDPDLPIYAPQTMPDRIASSLLTDRARMLLLVIFAGVALVLAAIGIYGVLAYSVALRTREIGIRVALGSRQPEIFRLVLTQGLKLLAIGLGLGVAASLALTRVLRGMLYGIEPDDPLVFAVVLAVLGAVAVVACTIPARRATRLDPIRALTQDA
jgi:predicted permease